MLFKTPSIALVATILTVIQAAPLTAETSSINLSLANPTSITLPVVKPAQTNPTIAAPTKSEASVNEDLQAINTAEGSVEDLNANVSEEGANSKCGWNCWGNCRCPWWCKNWCNNWCPWWC
ncbi:hypothetical protein BX616_004796 [Lobosporangium transversale]|uniref:Uncharacterized protein n=1 Tax=Lobosporangium transversale TaxID=64571 RepID=A0A1Y2GQY6_9FUNG|nr:hypothetical protein BCR41DRAFT_370066 [Lobosporangium transversale]KAF9897897.1 hypothetical protein BX616_004796 [Lobosporangium transversale]ORZ18256.1 hypothetical protein BCR41DRAFT_370066 [Lobosporangium transversale]|eukprot:XP_021882051.1 hypothetical protein BCR41DRAFT_370066 [Lobosporangium transversale]